MLRFAQLTTTGDGVRRRRAASCASSSVNTAVKRSPRRRRCNAKLAAAAIEVRIKDKESEQFKMEAKGRWLQAQGAQNASAIIDATRAQSIVSLANATAAAARIGRELY